MPEYPEIVVAVERLLELARGQPMRQVRLGHPFFLRTADPPISAVAEMILQDVTRLQKQIVFVLPNRLFLILHLMISGRLEWREVGCKIPRRSGLAAFDFAEGSLLITEPTTKKRASLHLVRGQAALRRFDRGGIEVMEVTRETFLSRIREENHTLKRALTDQRIVSGVGNAYSDEILHRARLSPFALTQQTTEAEGSRLHVAARETLTEWTIRVREAAGAGFPRDRKSTRREMAVHGKYGAPCPVCGTAIQRIRYVNRETNYCPRCQTGGRVLADRVLSRLLRDDWPRTVEELEERAG